MLLVFRISSFVESGILLSIHYVEILSVRKAAFFSDVRVRFRILQCSV